MRCILSLLTLVAVLFSPVSPAVWASEPKETAKDAAVAVNAFAVDLYTHFAAEKPDGNLFFSPFSISSALAMAFGGADGETAAEMAKVLRLESLSGNPHAAMKALRQGFSFPEGGEDAFEIANRIWVAREAVILPRFAELACQYYGSALAQLDFLKNPESARETINSWVAERTRDKIQNLLRQGDIQETTRLVLVNAVYFNSAWQTPFPKNATKEEPFYITAKKQKKVPLMHRVGSYPYRETEELQAVKIPYRLPGFSLLILLPRGGADAAALKALEKKLTPTRLASWTEDMEPRDVALRLPKFRDEERYSLKNVLEKLGMKVAFTDDADFSKMVEENDVKIDAALHQAVIDLDEEGTEAAAATALIMTMKSTAFPRPDRPVEFRADHPFIYAVTEDSSGAILFIGRMMEP